MEDFRGHYFICYRVAYDRKFGGNFVDYNPVSYNTSSPLLLSRKVVAKNKVGFGKVKYTFRVIDDLLSKTEYILKEAKARFRKPCILWSTGKDSTALLHMAKTTFFGAVPFDVVHIDTGMLFKEMYEFRDKIVEEWGLNLKVARRETDKVPGSGSEEEVFNCCMERKTLALKDLFQKEKYDAAILAIRWDELGVRGKERFFSPRTNKWEWKLYKRKTVIELKGGDAPVISLSQPEIWGLYQTDFGPECEHVRVHPILHWSEIEVWEYIKRNRVPFNPLYVSKEGRRYRSLGCVPCTFPVESEARTIEEFQEEIYGCKVREREGRRQKDRVMERLRYLGYM